MNTPFIENARLSHVHQKVSETQDWIEIYFRFNDYSYALNVERIDGVYRPHSILHESSRPCRFCQLTNKSWRECYILRNHKNDLFQRLIQFSHLRLHWVFFEHNT